MHEPGRASIRGSRPRTDGEPAPTPGPSGEVDSVPRRGLLSLRLGDARFGLWVDEVLEIVRTPPISRLPLPHPEVAGLTSVRGDLVPVLDLGVRLLSEPARRPGRLVLVRHEESESVVGLLVDGVSTLIQVAEGEVEEAPGRTEAGLPPGMVRGVVAGDDGVVTILDPVRVAAPPEEQPTKEQRR